ncbi:hypothetical protein VNI00_010993 [Paramarasmius palmivorus]|uniref:Uncharacterized protein n=1 Tax=Paramarasmius palmivorus TaxID=297713 RepID=A0AAW0CHN4_9AGAR
MDTIRVRFPADPNPVRFHYKPLQDGHGRQLESFKPLPVNDQCILEASRPTLRSQKLGPSFTHLWGKVDYFERSFPIFVCASSSAPSAPILVLKTALHINDGDPKYIEARTSNLEREAKFYDEHLQELQGSFVPEHYGIWESEETHWAGVIKCEIIAYGGEPLWCTEHLWRHDPNAKKLIAEAAEKLHDWCIHHTQLTTDEAQRHILWDQSKSKPMIIDFTVANHRHSCGRCIPLLPIQMSRWTLDFEADDTMCEELAEVGCYLDFIYDPDGYSSELLKEGGRWLRCLLSTLMAKKGRQYLYLEKERAHEKQKERLALWKAESSSGVASASGSAASSGATLSEKTDVITLKAGLAPPNVVLSDSNSSNGSSVS